jgi:hypothetical protein
VKPDYAKLYERIHAALGTPERREWLKELEAAALCLEREDRYEFRNALRAKHRDTIARLRAEVRELRKMVRALTGEHARTCYCSACEQLKQNGHTPKPKRKR